MQTERPIWHLSRCPSDLRILPRHLGRISLTASQEVKIEHAANDVILQRGRTLTVAANLHVHPGRAEKKDAMCAAVGTMLKIHRVIAVQVRAARNPIRVTGPQRARRVCRVQPERLRMLAEAVDVCHGWKRRLEAQVLRLEDERVVCDREQHLACANARDVEREWCQGVCKFDLRCIWVHVRVRRGSREDGLGDFVTFAGCVGDLEVNARAFAVGREKRPSEVTSYILSCHAPGYRHTSLIYHDKVEDLDVITKQIARLASEDEVG